MSEAYLKAESEIKLALEDGGRCLDCGAGEGTKFELLSNEINLSRERYQGYEWYEPSVAVARTKNINIIQTDLNAGMPSSDRAFKCVFGLSVLEHLLYPCKYLQECRRVLEPGGRLILLTPNISTFFTAALILCGKMPSSGPHPDSDVLLHHEEPFRVSATHLRHDTESDTPVHRHLVVFSYRVLLRYLSMLGFQEVQGFGFGLYPFPNFMQPVLEKLDPFHCHQMVIVAKK